MPDFSCFFNVSRLINYNQPVIFFSIGRLFLGLGVQFCVGRLSDNYRPTVVRLLMKSEPLNLGRLSGDHRATVVTETAGEFIIDRLSTDSRPTAPIIVRRLSDDRSIACPKNIKPRPIFFIVFMHIYFALFVCFLLWRKAANN